MQKIVDQFGNEIKTESRPPERTQSSVSVRDRYSNYPSARLTPYKLANLLKLADLGDISAQMELYEEMEEKDGHLGSVIQKRRLAITGLEFEIQTFSDDDKDKKIAEFVTGVVDGLPNFEDYLFDICDAIGKGFSGFEIDWDYIDGKHLPCSLKHVLPKKFTFYDSVTPRILTEAEQSKGEELQPFKFLFHIHKTRTTLPHKQGVLRTVTWMYLFKNYAVKDWVVFAEVFGIPLRVGRYDPNASEADKAALINAVRSLGSDSAAVISKATEIEFIEVIQKGSGEGVHERLANFCDKQMSKAVLGHSASVDSTAGKLGNEHQADEVREDILKADCEQISKSIRMQLIMPLVGFNFGFDASLPWFKLLYEPPEDSASEANLYGKHINNGYPITRKHYAQKFNLPLPEKDDELMRPNVANPQQGEVTELKNKSCPHHAMFVGKAGQQPDDDVADQITANASGQVDFDDFLKPIETMLNEVSSIAEFKEKLLDAYADIDPTQLGHLLESALVIAEGQGRFEVQGGE